MNTDILHADRVESDVVNGHVGEFLTVRLIPIGTPVTPSQGQLYFNLGDSKFKASEDGVTFVDMIGVPGSGTVTSVSVVSANGVSGSVVTATTTPAITLSLGAITPSSVAAGGTVTGSNLSGTNTGDQNLSGYATLASPTFTGTVGGITAAMVGADASGAATSAVSTHAALTTGVHGLAITSGQTLTVTSGGTLGSAAYTASTAYDAAGSAAAVTTTSIGAVPTARTLTINGTAQDLSADRSWTVTASVPEIVPQTQSLTGDLTIANGTSVVTARQGNVMRIHSCRYNCV